MTSWEILFVAAILLGICQEVCLLRATREYKQRCCDMIHSGLESCEIFHDQGVL
jgi:hypothetical protein